MKSRELGVFLVVVSHKRPDNVARMSPLIGDATWVVGVGEGDAYKRAGAKRVHEGGPLCASRNAALELAKSAGVPCLQLSDDMKKVQRARWNAGLKKVVAEDCTFADAAQLVLGGMERTGGLLGGVAPTANPFYANVQKPVHPSAFIVGDFIVVDSVRSHLRFDESMTLKEDYDFTLQHLSWHGMVARRDDVLVTFQHRTNPGGACSVRTAELEQQNIALLKAKWPKFIRDNPKRPNEIVLTLPRVKR